MSLSSKEEFRNALINDATLTNLVDAENIRVVFKRDNINFPSIIINQVGGTDVASIGYKHSTSGNKERLEKCSYQLSILSRESILELETISDAINTVLSKDTDNLKGLEKTSDLDSYYDEELGAYVKMVTWNFFRYLYD